MDAARWERMQSLFHEALALPEARRPSFLAEKCEGDAALLADVLAILAADAGGDSLLSGGLATLANDVLDGPGPAHRAIGRYRVLRTLGQGGMGVVYLAERDDLEHRVAIKVLRDALLSPARRERFALEERVLAQLDHPSIARLYDADSLPDGTPYFVMEYVEGVPLTTFCETHRSSLAERLRLFRAVCEAVQHAHRQAVVHRDLKPSNILVRADGQVKLLDFGIAKKLESVGAPADPTRTGLRMMTPAYASPEQIRAEAVGVYTDVYALGVILYEMLTGQAPFELAGRTPGEMEVMILTREPERPSARSRRAGDGAPVRARRARDRPGWRDLDVLCLTAMHKDPRRRYATVEALVRDLDHFSNQRPLEARRDTLGYRAGKFLRRNARPVTVAAAVATAVVGLVAFYTVELAAARDAALAEADKAEQISEYLIGLFEASDPFGSGPDDLEVRTLLQRGVESAEALGTQPAVHAQVLDVLGRVYTQLSLYDDAGLLLRRALALRQAGAEPLDLAESSLNLGRLHALTGGLDSAAVYLRESLSLRRRHLSPDDPEVAVVLNDLGDLHTTRGRYAEAEALYREALGIQRAAYPEPHEDLGHTLNNLAVNFFNQADPEAAEPYYREALEVYRAVFGAGHPTTAMAMANLAMVLEARGELEAADSMHVESLRVRRRTLGNWHYLTAVGLTQLGSVARKRLDFDRAERYLRESVAINDSLLGPRHLNTAVARQTLAWTLRDRGEYAAAEPLLRDVSSFFREELGEGHYYTGASLCNLAEVLHMQGRAGDEAESLFREGLAILRTVLPAGHASLAVNQSAFGRLLAAQSRFAEAEPLLLAGHESLSAAGHPGARDAALRLVELYEAWGRPDRAEAYRSEAAAVEPGT